MAKRKQAVSTENTPLQDMTEAEINDLFQLEASTTELNKLLVNNQPLQKEIADATNDMKSKLRTLYKSNLELALIPEDNKELIKTILLNYKIECDKHVGHSNILLRIIYASIITIAAALLGAALAATVCSGIGIVGAAATLGVAGGFAAGAALGYTSSIIGFFTPNKFQKGVNKLADDAEKSIESALELNNP